MSKIFYFNFCELQKATDDQVTAIFVLLTGITLGYNNYRFNSIVDFRYKCFPLIDIPYILSKKLLVRKNYYKEYEVLYRTKEIQSYFTNEGFLKVNCEPYKKVQYAKLLSYRSINNSNSWIPTDMVSNLEKIQNNELLTIHSNKIYFNYEGKE